ncbi:hypothetical protein [Fuerstiella marisgermanici]|uniref:Uncharacterized protein n=1 Tax=Fuerstiella marisgermanici TaxID=1891926 RepID=A0A1P8WJ45_9PLAN|nr:hypothetical protein [Fuerstiella marisgermanici]APZ94074.1 hypothetical protein Fuma_03695 [Fuerstiella marisgermanici]
MASLRFTCSAVGIVALLTSTASAQLNGVAGAAAAARSNTQIQQQVQNQVQQQVQAQAQVQQQVQARAQAQVQSRIQAEAARAASIAQRVTLTAQNQVAAAVSNQAAAARQRASSGLNVRLAANARIGTNVGVGTSQARMDTNTAARLGLDTRLSLPADLTRTDVQVYDNIFGRFNPLRKPANETPNPTVSVPQPNADPSASDESPEGGVSSRSRSGLLASLESDASLSTRINVAARQRRAQISEVRDRALATSDTQLMLKAQKMEDALNAFASAQTQLQAKANGKIRQAAQSQPKGLSTKPVSQVNFSANGSATTSAAANNGQPPSAPPAAAAPPAAQPTAPQSDSGSAPAGSVQQ